MNDELLKFIQEMAERPMASEQEDFDPSASGNFDDAYALGVADGRIDFAGEILARLRRQVK